MTPQERVLAEAAKWIGTTENPPDSNRTVFAAALDRIEQPPIPRNGSAWCSTFQKFCFVKSGANAALRGALMFYTPADAQVFRRAGEYYADPQVGDLAFYHSTVKGRISHVGIVEAVEKSYITTIEGNTSSKAAGSQDNGGVVARRRRLRSWWAGYGRPDWAAVVPPPPPFLTSPQEDDPMRMFRPAGHYDILLGPIGPNGGYQHIVQADIPGLLDLMAAGLVTGVDPSSDIADDYDAAATVISPAAWTLLAGQPVGEARTDGKQ